MEVREEKIKKKREILKDLGYFIWDKNKDMTIHLTKPDYKIFSYFSITRHFLSPRENDVARNVGDPKYIFFPEKDFSIPLPLPCLRISPSGRMERDGLEIKRPMCWSGPPQIC